MRGAKSAPGPSAGAAICPAPFRDGTPASSLTAAPARAGFLPLGFVTPQQELTVLDRSTTRVTRGFAAALMLAACSTRRRLAPRHRRFRSFGRAAGLHHRHGGAHAPRRILRHDLRRQHQGRPARGRRVERRRLRHDRGDQAAVTEADVRARRTRRNRRRSSRCATRTATAAPTSSSASARSATRASRSPTASSTSTRASRSSATRAATPPSRPRAVARSS